MRSCKTLVPLAVVWGVFRLSACFAPEMWRAEQGPSVNFALVQRNCPCVFKAGDGNPIEKYTELLAHVGLLRPDVVVLPESALCEFGDVRSQRAKLFASGEENRPTYIERLNEVIKKYPATKAAADAKKTLSGLK